MAFEMSADKLREYLIVCRRMVEWLELKERELDVEQVEKAQVQEKTVEFKHSFTMLPNDGRCELGEEDEGGMSDEG